MVLACIVLYWGGASPKSHYCGCLRKYGPRRFWYGTNQHPFENSTKRDKGNPLGTSPPPTYSHHPTGPCATLLHHLVHAHISGSLNGQGMKIDMAYKGKELTS